MINTCSSRSDRTQIQSECIFGFADEQYMRCLVSVYIKPSTQEWMKGRLERLFMTPHQEILSAIYFLTRNLLSLESTHNYDLLYSLN